MYSSLKKRQNRVKYSVSYKEPESTLGDNWYEKTSDSYKETVEDLNKINEPDEKLDETVLSNPVINSVTEDPKSLIYPINGDTSTDQVANLSSPGKKTTFSMNKLFMFILVIFLLYCLYNYSNKSIGKSFFGARECISYDISNAYNMVR